MYFITLAVSATFGQSVFNKIYYGNSIRATGGARANTVIQTFDSGFLVSGATDNLLTMYSIKTNFFF